MLDATTKRKIDSARQILVGKVPDPKAQVEQITTALVYKFMDDMDKEAEELGGKAKFFTDDLKDFAWSKLLDTRYSGQERMDLYVRAISAFAKAKQLPQLFRDIFKDAFLPYRDPETLSLFLKEIDNFTYDHSEDLGNAFEYLLSVLGSQGDAGQFRTPRHIIDFIVAIIDPKKNETVLDPACGTAGFLISAYKHIRKHNSSNFKPEKEKAEEKLPEGETIAETVLAEKTYRGDQLTPSERGKLMNNFVGYDISPDMVKLSLVNMYLHGFSDPKIYEYDTLTSEKHWGEQFDVIMANPPFMSPKGGIRPHRRFSVQASRSEVLFVDYILEHLALKGRAGIIVPEGIIFKTENAYKQLRQMLIEDGLFAVVSLPPGVFNPYSGVKTSILLFDNELAKKSDEILFIKILNDGFDLGAQRRKVDRNDLPHALEVIEAQKIAIQVGRKNSLLQKGSMFAWAVKKAKIAESGDYNLTGERYKETEIRKNQKWPLVELGDEEYFQIESGGTPDSKNKEYWDGKIAWVTLVDLPTDNRITEIQKTERTITDLGLKKSSAKLLPENSVLVSSRATIGRIGITKIPLATNQGFKNIIIKNFSKVSPVYLANVLTQKVDEMKRLGTGGTYKEISKSNFSKIKIPLPPLEVQKEIVEQIEVKQNAINHAKEIIKNLERERRYFGQELRKLEDVEWVELGQVAEVIPGQSPESKYYNTNNKGLPFYQGKTEFTDRIIGEPKYWTTKTTKVAEKNDILMSVRAPVGPVNFTTQEICIGRGLAAIRIKNNERVNNIYLFTYLQSIQNEIVGSGGAVFDSINRSQIEKIKIPIPLSTDTKTSMDIQSEIVEMAEWEEEIIASNRRLIELMERKIGQVLTRI